MVRKGRVKMAEIKDAKLIRDAIGSPVPQHLNEDLADYVVKTVDGSLATRGEIDFSKTKLLRDKLGSPIPQLWDVVNNKWVVDMGQSNAHTHRISEIIGLQEKLDELWAAIGVEPEVPNTPPILAGHEYPELIGKKWINFGRFYAVLDNVENDFYVRSNDLVGNSGSYVLYRVLDGPSSLAFHISGENDGSFDSLSAIKFANTPIYNDSTLKTIVRNADNGKPVELVKTYGFTSYNQTGFNDSLASYGGSYKVLNEVSLVGAKIQLSKAVSDATVELYNSADVLVSSKKFSSESGFVEVIFDKATLLSGNSNFTLVYRGSSIVEVGSIVYEENLSFNNRLFTFSMTEMPTITNNNYIYYIEPIYAVA